MGQTSNLQFAILATDVVVFKLENDQLKVLLVKAKSPSFPDQWATPGGLVSPNESIESAASRYLFSCLTGHPAKVFIEQLFTFGDPTRDPSGRVVSVAYMALIPPTGFSLKPHPAYPDIAWFPAKTLPSLAYDHQEIITTAKKRLRAKLGYTNIIFALMPDQFTLTELQTAYQVVLNRPLDKRNFRKKIKSLGLIKRLPQKRRGEPHRPAQLYCFKTRSLQEAEIL